MKSRRKAPRGLWQSFADLAMGVMAVVILVLMVVLERQADDNKEFTRAILTALEEGRAVVRGQDAVDTWLEALFEVGECELSYDAPTGRLTLRGETADAKELYATGRVSLRAEAQEELRRCGDAFLTLSICLDPGARKLCDDRLRNALGEAGYDKVREGIAAETDWSSVEALVIQGHTDRQRFLGARQVEGLPDRLDRHTSSFIANAYLGSERARQAMGHLLSGVSHSAQAFEPEKAEPDRIYAMLERIAVESPSFGRFQADPDSPAAGESCLEADCETARRLALRVRWKRESLREPLEQVRRAFCEKMRAEQRAGGTMSERIEKACAHVGSATR